MSLQFGYKRHWILQCSFSMHGQEFHVSDGGIALFVQQFQSMHQRSVAVASS
jgi:hypothetical protein